MKSPAVAVGNNVLAVVGGEGDKLVAIAAGNELSEAKVVDLPSGYAAGPWLVGSQVLVQLDNEQLVCFDNQLAQLWTSNFESDQLAAPPTDNGSGEIILAFRSGRMVTLNASSGEAASDNNLGQPIIHQPLVVDGKVYFAGLDGTLHITNAQ